MQRNPTVAGVLSRAFGVTATESAAVAAAFDSMGMVQEVETLSEDCCETAAVVSGLLSLTVLEVEEQATDDDDDADDDDEGAERLRTMPDRMLFCEGLVFSFVVVTLGLAISA